MGKFSESSYNILNEYFGIIKESSGEANSYLIGPRKTIVAKGGVVTHLYEKRSTGELIGYKFRITEISGNNFKFEYKGLLRDHSLAVGDFTIGNEMYFRKDAFFHDWLNVNSALYRDDVNTNRMYVYFGKIYDVPNETNMYSVVFEGMKDYMTKALPENNRTTKLEEFLKVYFDQVHHSVYNMTKNLWSLLDPKEIDIRFLNLIALDYGIEIDEDLPESNLREWVDTIIYFLKRKGDYASIYIIFKLLLGNTDNKLNIYERWAEWCSSELSDVPSFENDHHILEYYNTQAAGGAGTDYYSQYNPSSYPTYTDTAPSGECLKNIWLCGTNENYYNFSGLDTGNTLTIAHRTKLTVSGFDKSTDDLTLSLLNTTPSGNFLHCVKTNLSSTSTSGAGLYIWGIGDQDVTWSNYTTSNWLGVSLEWYNGAYEFKVSEGYNNGSTVQSEYSISGYSDDTDYYLGIERINSDLSLYIFNNADRSNLLEVITLNLLGASGSNGAFNYLFGLNTLTSSGSTSWSGDIFNLATGAASATGVNETNSLVLTPHYKIEIDLSSEPVGDNYIINKYLMDELIRYWEYTKPVSKYVHYEQLIAPTGKMNEEGEYISLYDEHENAFLNTQFTGSTFLSGATPVVPTGNDAGSVAYTHKQLISSYNWIVQHDLGTRNCLVQCYDNNRKLIWPKEVQINNENRITLVFGSAARGEAYIAGIRDNYDYLHTETTQRTPPVLDVSITTETVSSGTISGSTFIDVNSESTPFISYYNYGTDKVKYATKVSDVWYSEEVDSCDGNNTIKIDIDTLGVSHIAYNYDNNDIVYANNSTGTWVPVIVGSDGINGQVVLIIDSLNNPHVIYSAEIAGIGYLQHAIKDGGLWSYDTIDTSPSGNYKDMSVTLSSDGNVNVSYIDDYVGELKFADGNTSSWNVTAANVSGASYTSTVLDSTDTAHVVYKNSSNEYEHITSLNGSFVTKTIDSNVGADFNYTSLGIDDSDNLHTIYESVNGSQLRYAKIDTTAWTGWSTILISSTPSGADNMGFSLKLDEFNILHATYSEYTSASSNLKYLTLTSTISGYTAFDWTVNHSLSTSGASGIIAQYYNNDYVKNQMVPVSQNPTSDDIMVASWNKADAYRGTAPVRRIDYTWNTVDGADNRWNFNNGDLEGWTATNADIYATDDDTMLMTPTNWVYGDSAEPEIRKVDLSFTGSDNTEVTARVKVTDASNSWTGRIYWKTSLHDESELFYKEITNSGDANYDWQVIEWDMSDVSDWVNNTITGIRLDMEHDDYTYNRGLLLNTDNASFEIDEPGRAYEENGSFCRVEGIDLSPYTIPDNQAIKVIIDSSLIDETLTDFPVMVNISTSAGTGDYDTGKLFDVLDIDAKKEKLTVTNIDGTVEYFCERGEWTPSAGTAILWVKVPTISSTTDTEFLLTWNLSGSDNNYIGDIGSTEAQNVWSDSFAAVWHMGQNPADGVIYDSTTNELHGIPSAGADSSNYVDGLIGKAYLFTGADDETIGIGIHNELIFGNDTYDAPFSIELLSKSEVVSGGTEAVYEESSYQFDARSPSGAHFKLNDVGGSASLDAYTATLSGYAGQFIHQTATYDGTGNDTGLKIYIDGVDATDSTSETGTYVAMDDEMEGTGLIIGHDMYNVEQTYDEVRIHSVERSAAWTKASKHSQFDTLISYEDAQQRRTHSLRLLDTTGLEASGWIGGSDEIETLGDNIEVVSITQSTSGSPGLMTITGSAGLPSGGLIKFHSLSEMTELNDGYSTVTPYSTSANDYSTSWNEYNYGADILPWNNESIFSSMVYNNQLYVGTGWTYSNESSASRMLRWDGGSDWTELASTPTTASTDRLHALTAYNDKIYTVSDGALYEWDEAGGWILKASKYYYPGVDYADLVYDLLVYEGRLYGCTDGIDFTHSGVLLRWNDVDAWELAADRYTTGSGWRHCFKIFEYNGSIYGSVSYIAVKWDGIMGSNWINTGAAIYYAEGYEAVELNGKMYSFSGLGIYDFDGTSSSLAYTMPGTSNISSLVAYHGYLYAKQNPVNWNHLYRIDIDAQTSNLAVYDSNGTHGQLINWNDAIWFINKYASTAYDGWLGNYSTPYEIRDTSQYAAETTGGYCQVVENVGETGVHVFSDSISAGQSWNTIENGFNWNDTEYTVLVTSTIVTGKFEFDWIMTNNIPATWNIEHNLNAGGLIVECFDDVGETIRPQDITLTTPNSASIAFPASTVGSANFIYFPRTFVIETNEDDITGVGIGENLGYWKIGDGEEQEYNPAGANDIQSTTLSGSFDNVYENDSGTHYIIEFVISSITDLTITEIGLFNEDGNIMFYTLCSPLFKPADINLRMFYRIEKTE